MLVHFLLRVYNGFKTMGRLVWPLMCFFHVRVVFGIWVLFLHLRCSEYERIPDYGSTPGAHGLDY